MKLINFIIFLLIICLVPQLVSAVPQLPMIVEGNVTIDGELAPASTLLTAKINEKVRAEYTLLDKGAYVLTIPGNESDKGSIVDFYVNNINTGQNSTWESGRVIDNFNLNIDTVTATGSDMLYFLIAIIAIIVVICLIYIKLYK